MEWKNQKTMWGGSLVDVVQMLEETRLRRSVILHYGMWGCRGGDNLKFRPYHRIGPDTKPI